MEPRLEKVLRSILERLTKEQLTDVLIEAITSGDIKLYIYSKEELDK